MIADLDDVPDSRPIRPPTVDERVRDLEVAFDSRAREMIDVHTRLKSVEGFPADVARRDARFAWAIIGGLLTVVVAVLGVGWSLSAQLARIEERQATSAAEDARRDVRLDRLEERTWRVDTTTRASGGE